MQHEPLLVSETLRGFGVLMLRVRCVGEKDAAGGTLGE